MPTTFPLLFDELIYQMILDIFGNPLLIMVFFVIWFYMLGLAFKLSYEMLFMFLILSVFTVLVGLFPNVGAYMLIPLGVFIGLYLFYTILRG